MLLDERFPESDPGFRSAGGFYKSSKQLECFHCSEQTAWFHLGNLLSFCSYECYQRYLIGEKSHARLAAPT